MIRAALLAAFAIAGCDSRTPVSAATPERPIGDATRGLELATRLECARCHTHRDLAPPPIERACVGCHVEILEGGYDAAPEELADWRAHLVSLPAAPSLDSARRLRPEAIAAFLLDPHDVRPNLPATMPRLALTETDARDLAAWLTAGAKGPGPSDPVPLAHGAEGPGPSDPSRGRELFERRGCPTCHSDEPTATGRGMWLAPDLCRARERMTREAIVQWILAPDPPMPPLVTAREEAEDIAAYLIEGSQRCATPSSPPSRLPVLERRVTFDEVNEAVFRRTCWHCHADPTYAYGDGGPGNTGGFGFAPRGLSFADHPSILSGARADDGTRRSIFRPVPLADGTQVPYVVAALLARREEEAGRPVANVRGMPLGLPPLSLEQIQLVESWIASGRPQ